MTVIAGNLLIGHGGSHIQLGLDQLHEAQSKYLGLFVHYASLAFNSGALIFTSTAKAIFLCRTGSSSSNLHHLYLPQQC